VLEVAAGLIGKFLDSKIDVGIIGDVWQWFQHQVGIVAADRSGLTLGGLVSLVIAVPTTVFYKLVYGVDAQPFPHGALPSADVAAAAGGDQGGDACVLVGMFAAILNNIVQDIADTYVFVKVLSPYDHSENVPLLQDIEVWLGFATIALGIATNTFSWPSESAIPFSHPDLDSDGGKATFANWMINWGPPGFDFVFALLSVVLHNEKKAARVMQFVDPLGVYFDAFLALGTLIAGIVESALAEENALQWSANIFLPLATISLPLRSRLVTQFKPLLPYLLWLAITKGGLDGISVLGSTFKWAWMPSKRVPGHSAIAA
jgi:hypothetical protein